MNNLRGQMLRSVLKQRCGDAPDASTIAAASFLIWQDIAAHLTQIIGVRGVGALYTRSLHVAANTIPWIANAGDHHNADPFQNLKACLQTREPADAEEASWFLMVTFTDLLAALIGESLVEHLLNSVWESAPPSITLSKQENSL